MSPEPRTSEQRGIAMVAEVLPHPGHAPVGGTVVPVPRKASGAKESSSQLPGALTGLLVRIISSLPDHKHNETLIVGPVVLEVVDQPEAGIA